MRSETTPFWVTTIWALGFFMLLAAGIALYKGEVKITRNTSYSRAEQPEAFWGWVGSYLAIGAVAFIWGTLHFGPGG
ncbi:MAG TPA: hypothetical protein VEC11_00955 [Allosphingosinicella sp.]|nr:hypothetical protein [Allosphingosinicella sp.]